MCNNSMTQHVQQFDDIMNLVVLQIKFPISQIAHLNLTDDSSVVVSTNRGTIGPYMVIPTLE